MTENVFWSFWSLFSFLHELLLKLIPECREKLVLKFLQHKFCNQKHQKLSLSIVDFAAPYNNIDFLIFTHQVKSLQACLSYGFYHQLRKHANLKQLI